MVQNGQTEPVRHKAPVYSCCVALRIIWIGDINLSTYREIAKMAGISVSTVSKALSGYGEISQDTKDTIYLIAKQSVYFSDILAFARTIFLFHKSDIAPQRYEINSLPKGISLCVAQYLYAVISLIPSGINLVAECPLEHSAKSRYF